MYVHCLCLLYEDASLKVQAFAKSEQNANSSLDKGGGQKSIRVRNNTPKHVFFANQ